ncbi:MAG: acyl-CoA dehydrogenase family protein [Clostridiales bacterium]|nr:acyl-CoA dehydrogenase family protein [Clostridiales bacterium]
MKVMEMNELQKDLQSFAREFAQKEIAPIAPQIDHDHGEFPMDVFHKFCDAGFNTMFLPEEYGGQGLGAMEEVIIGEEFCKADAGFYVSATTGAFGIEPVLLFGNEEQKHYYADYLLQGKLASFALTEADAGSDASNTRTTAVRDGDDYILNGSKCFITSGGLADIYTVFATVDRSKGVKGITCFIVERSREGVSVGKAEDKMGMVLSNTTELIFDNVRIPAKNRVGEEGEGFKIAMASLDRSRGIYSYGALGVAQRAIDVAVDYAKQRKTFGKPIIKHQGIQFMLADMEIQTTAARSLLWHCAQMVDEGNIDSRMGAITKTFCSDACMKVTTDAVQILGGYGYSREYPVEKLMRDAKLLQIFEGTNQIQRIVISREMSR